MRQTVNELEDYKVNLKIKLALLWTAVMFCYIYGDYFELYVPSKMADFISGDTILNTPLKLFSASVLLAIPACMIFLSIFLKPRLNRILNIVFGVFFTCIMLLIAVRSLTQWYIFYVFLAILESVITSLIVWYAIKWPKAKSE